MSTLIVSAMLTSVAAASGATLAFRAQGGGGGDDDALVGRVEGEHARGEPVGVFRLMRVNLNVANVVGERKFN